MRVGSSTRVHGQEVDAVSEPVGAADNEPSGGGVEGVNARVPVTTDRGVAAPIGRAGASDNGDRVLVIDDEPDIAELVGVTLRTAGYSVEVAHGGTEGLAKASARPPAAVLLDVMMPGLTGLQVCEALRQDVATATTSIIMLTARRATADQVEALRRGADDYITKPFDPDELVARVETALRRGRKLREVSPLTGLPGNFEITRQLELLIIEPEQNFALIHADLDSFKPYNDRYGFLKGDDGIRTTAEVLLSELSKVETKPRFLGHLGGDDFALLVADDATEEVASRIVAAFDAVAPSLYDPADAQRGYIEVRARDGGMGRYPLLSISLGIATTRRRRYSSAHEAAAVATEMKEVAKLHPGSTWRLDRRGDT
jgi:diguanylate cyclase (GGDEF)-like protein